MIDRLLPFAQFFIKFQPQAAQVFDNPGRFTDALHVYIQLLRRDVEPDAIGDFCRKLFRRGSVKMFSIWVSSKASISFVESVRIRSCMMTGSWLSNSRP